MLKAKTLLISEIFPPIHGGSGRWFWELYSRLPRDEYLIAAGISKQSAQFDKTHDLSITRLSLSSFSWGIKSLAGLKFYIKTFWQIRKLVSENRVKQIHCGRCLPEGVFGYLFNKIYGIPYLCYIHGEDIETASSSRELSFIVNKVLSSAARLIANSKNTRYILINHWQVKQDKITVLNPGMDAKLFIPANINPSIRGKLGWKERPVLLTVGRLQKRKGQDMLVRALPEIIKFHENILYSIIGDGEEMDALITLVENLGLKNHVQFLSEVTDKTMIQCYQQCTIFVLPNRTVDKDIEGFGMVLVEAQACGKPVIAGDSGGTAETMIDGKTGFIVDCTKPSPLAKKIIEMLNHQVSLSEMGKKARTHVEINLDWEVHTLKAITIFQSISLS